MESSAIYLQCRDNLDCTTLTTVGSETHISDPFGRSTNISYFGTLAIERSYGCCGIEWETDRDGVTSTFEYDSLKRLWTTTRNYITISNSYDAMGNVVSVTRYGGTNTIPLQRKAYDLAGRLISETNALGSVTHLATAGLNDGIPLGFSLAFKVNRITLEKAVGTTKYTLAKGGRIYGTSKAHREGDHLI